jgi:hypothetical protein
MNLNVYSDDDFKVAFLKFSSASIAFPLFILSRDNLTPSLKSFAKPETTNAAEAFKST